MYSARPFAYITSGTTLEGTTITGNLMVATDLANLYTGNIDWIMGPDEIPGYIIAYPYIIENRPSYNIGDSLYGGIVFYTWSGGTYGLVAQTGDTSISAAWGCMGTWMNSQRTGIATGNLNTTAIMSGCPTRPIAASVCRALGTDWYLPSYDELYQMSLQSVLISLGAHQYWSSTESTDSVENVAWALYIPAGDGGWSSMAKSNTNYVRAIRQIA